MLSFVFAFKFVITLTDRCWSWSSVYQGEGSCNSKVFCTRNLYDNQELDKGNAYKCNDELIMWIMDYND